jgi:hypothetical protein
VCRLAAATKVLGFGGGGWIFKKIFGVSAAAADVLKNVFVCRRRRLKICDVCF